MIAHSLKNSLLCAAPLRRSFAPLLCAAPLRRSFVAAVVFIVQAAQTPVKADSIVQPSGISLQSAGVGNASLDGNLTNTINGYGLATTITNAVGSINQVTNGAPVLPIVNAGTYDTNGVEQQWYTPGHENGSGFASRLNGGFTGAVIKFDLDQKYTLNGIFLWNYAELFGGAWYNGRGLKDVTVDLYNDSIVVYSQNVIFAAAGTNNAFLQASYTSLTNTAIANHVTFTINHNLYGETNGYVGYGEVRFTSVPEPSTYALFGLGAFALLFAVRRKVA